MKPTDTMYFGKYEGYKIFQYDPSYLEWLVKYIDKFIIDINEFDNLPEPTPYLYTLNRTTINSYFGRPANFRTGINFVKDAIQYEHETGSSLKSEPFKFKNETIEIINLKRTGMYEAPKWNPLDLQGPANQMEYAD